jgi:hypothetical protein
VLGIFFVPLLFVLVRRLAGRRPTPVSASGVVLP